MYILKCKNISQCKIFLNKRCSNSKSGELKTLLTVSSNRDQADTWQQASTVASTRASEERRSENADRCIRLQHAAAWTPAAAAGARLTGGMARKCVHVREKLGTSAWNAASINRRLPTRRWCWWSSCSRHWQWPGTRGSALSCGVVGWATRSEKQPLITLWF